MKFTDIIKRSGRSLKTAKLRTLLTALAIAVGGFTICLTLAAGNGVRDYTNTLITSNFDPAELIVGRDQEIGNNSAPSNKPQEFDDSVTSFQSGGPSGSFQFKQVTREDINEISAVPGVEQVRENYNLNIRYVTREGQKRYTGSAEQYNPAQRPELLAGALPSEGDIPGGSILLPGVYLEPLGFGSAEEAIGQTVRIAAEAPFTAADLTSVTERLSRGEQIDTILNEAAAMPSREEYAFVVGAVTKRPATSLDFGVKPLLINATDAREIYDFTTKGTANYDKYLFVNVRVVDGTDKTKRDEVRQQLEGMGYFVQSAEDIQKAVTQFVDILQGAVFALGFITLIASVFGIINTQYISVLERTREIGLVKALGMSRRKVLLLFIVEATWIGMIGGVIGIVFGFIVGSLLNPVINRSLDLGVGNYLIQFSWWQMLLLLGSLMLVAALSGLLPARKAARMDPVEALRTE